MSNLSVPLPDNEIARQDALLSYQILDTASEKDFDDIAELASAICQTPIALVGFLDDKRHWFKAKKGTELSESGKDISFCAHAIASTQPIMLVEDTRQDQRFKQNPIVTGMGIAFYAGVPLVNNQGFSLGTLCVFDVESRKLSDSQQMALQLLGRQVIDKLELRKKVIELETANQRIVQLNQDLESRKEDLQTANEETAVVNEELRTSNEELLAINNELTTLNEEMLSMNEELRNSYDEQEYLNNQLKASEFTLKAAFEQAKLAKQAAQLGLFDLDVVNDKLVWDERCKELFGVSANQHVTYTTDFVQGLHPDDREHTLQAVSNAYNQTLTGGRYDVEYRTVGVDDGRIRHVRAIGQVFFNDLRVPQRFIGSVMDITDTVAAREELLNKEADLQQINEELATSNEELISTNEELQSTNEQLMQVQQQLQENEAQLRLITDNMAQLAWMADASGTAYWFNERWYQYTGDIQVDTKSNSWQNLLHPDYAPQIIKKYNQYISHGDTWEDTFPLLGANGQYRWFLSRSVPYRNAAGFIEKWFGTCTDVTEQRRDDQRKNDFISMVSHELKTPLTSTIGYIQVSRSRAAKNGDELMAGLMNKAAKQLAKMTTMINGFLNVSRLESGKIHINKQKFDMAALLQEVEEETLTTINSHRIIFTPASSVWLSADRDKIGQVINNYISNAAKYSPAGTTIKIDYILESNKLRLSVKDEGIGIPSEEQGQLFERYYRVKGQQTKDIAGFGIGLYLCREIIEHHKGEVGVSSEVGEGSTFWFTIAVSE
ncbi:ATP-binding protein [Mucilaginibacter sp. CSA2-8R]|uniref:ATP-binding protein n=1 Tax=Mucilaginibacter sp. CSA2-8R TaxID=3141542 RepID=UPI00315D5C1B